MNSAIDIDLAIRDVDILTMADEEIIKNGEIGIVDDEIKFIGHKVIPSDARIKNEINGSKMVAMPGLINCHTHAAMTLFRGYADDLPLMEWLNEKIWPLEARLKAEDVYYGTLLACVEMIKSGTTTFADMYFFMDEAAKAVEKSGMRAVLSRGLIGVAPNAKEALEESKEFVQRYNGAADGRIIAMLGPHAPYTCPPEFLKEVIEVAGILDIGIHIHVAETLSEHEEIMKKYGKTPVQHLNSLGLFEVKTIAAHCVHLSDEDIAVLAEKKVGVAHNPKSNMKLASGIAPVDKMIKSGVDVGLGTDGAASNNSLSMIEEMRFAALLQKVAAMDPTAVPAYAALKMATVDAAKALGISDKVGKLAKGFKADIILIDFDKPHLYPHHDICAHIVYTVSSADVDTVIIDGKVIMKNRKLLTLDEKLVADKLEYSAKQLVKTSHF